MWRRILAGVLGVFNAINGLIMLFDPAGWYSRVPGVPATGPFNLHFVQDVGLAFLASALGLLALAWRRNLWPAALAGSGFLVFHALLHVWIIAQGHTRHAAFELAIVVAPAVLALLASWPTKGVVHA
jgi:hypothetical protein